MTINASSNPVNQVWKTWQQYIHAESKSTGGADSKDISHATPAVVDETDRRQKAQRQHQPANSLTQLRLSQARAAEPAQTPGIIFTTLVDVPRSPSGAPITHEFDNGNVKITSSPLHPGSFNGVPIQRNKVTIETGGKDDLVEIKTLTTGGVVAEINGKAYALPIENIGAMTEQLEIKTNGGKDHVTIADNIWFETTVSLNDSHRVTGLNGYISAPESSGQKTFLEPGVIPVASQMKQEGNSQVFRHGDVTITFDPNKNALQFGDGVTIIKTGDGADTVHIMAAEDGSMVAQINGEKFLLPIKNDATGRSRLYITTQGGDDKTIIDSNVKNYAFILPGEDKNGSLYRGGGFVSGAEEPRLAQRYRPQNYNPTANA
ncbi:hypothetical protein LRS56_19470 [Pseudomonas poae]|nr:hypothetical protein LRS56_19470 [Pseudomonas poae]